MMPERSDLNKSEINSIEKWEGKKKSVEWGKYFYKWIKRSEKKTALLKMPFLFVTKAGNWILDLFIIHWMVGIFERSREQRIPFACCLINQGNRKRKSTRNSSHSREIQMKLISSNTERTILAKRRDDVLLWAPQRKNPFGCYFIFVLLHYRNGGKEYMVPNIEVSSQFSIQSLHKIEINSK